MQEFDAFASASKEGKLLVLIVVEFESCQAPALKLRKAHGLPLGFHFVCVVPRDVISLLLTPFRASCALTFSSWLL